MTEREKCWYCSGILTGMPAIVRTGEGHDVAVHSQCHDHAKKYLEKSLLGLHKTQKDAPPK